MKKLSQAKRNQLVLVIMGTSVIICVIYFFLIDPQKQQNRLLQSKGAANVAKLAQIRTAIKQTDAIAKQADDLNAKLVDAETDVASGDMFAWTYDTIRRFKTGYHVDIPNIGQPVQSEVDLIANSPYKQIKFSIAGTGYFHDIGKFIADMENKFPHMRVLNLSMEPTSDQSGEKLAFRMEVAALVKPNS